MVCFDVICNSRELLYGYFKNVDCMQGANTFLSFMLTSINELKRPMFNRNLHHLNFWLPCVSQIFVYVRLYISLELLKCKTLQKNFPAVLTLTNMTPFLSFAKFSTSQENLTL